MVAGGMSRQTWRDGRGRKVPSPALAKVASIRTTKVVLAAAHLDHDPAHCGRKHRNVRALCQRCHLLHDRPEHRRRIRLTLRRRRALGDLFSGPTLPGETGRTWSSLLCCRRMPRPLLGRDLPDELDR